MIAWLVLQVSSKIRGWAIGLLLLLTALGSAFMAGRRGVQKQAKQEVERVELKAELSAQQGAAEAFKEVARAEERTRVEDGLKAQGGDDARQRAKQRWSQK